MALPLLSILANTIRAGLASLRARKATDWFRTLVKQRVVKVALKEYRTPNAILTKEERTSRWKTGSMYFFNNTS